MVRESSLYVKDTKSLFTINIFGCYNSITLAIRRCGSERKTTFIITKALYGQRHFNYDVAPSARSIIREGRNAFRKTVSASDSMLIVFILTYTNYWFVLKCVFLT